MAKTKKYEIEFTDKGKEKKDEDLLKFMEKEFGRAKDQKRDREKVIENNTDELKKIENNIDLSGASGRLGMSFPQKEYISPLLVLVIQEMVSSDWLPNIDFVPEERLGEGSDVFLARNAGNVHDFILDNGEFYSEAQKGAVDLFGKGRMYLRKEYVTQSKEVEEGERYEMPMHIKFKYIPWERVYRVFDGGGLFIKSEYTRDELIEEFGEVIKKRPIRAGAPFEGQKLPLIDFDADRVKQAEDKITVYEYYNGDRKIHSILIGGGAYLWKLLQNKTYPKAWIGKNNKGFIPVDEFDGGVAPYGNHPLSIIDLIVRSWRSNSTMMNATIRRAIRAADPPIVVGSAMSPKDARREWMQAEVDRMQMGIDIPTFMKTDGVSNAFSVDVLDVGVNNANAMQWRDIFLDEIMMATGINIRALGQGAPTAEQERLRVKRELDTVTKIIKINEPKWQRFAMTNMYMLKNVDSDFLDKFIYIEDEVSDELGENDEGTVRDIIDNLEEFEFNIRVSINNSNSRRKEIELLQKQEALNTMAQFFPESPAIREMAQDIAAEQFPQLKLTAEQFEAPPLEEEAPLAPAGAGVPPEAIPPLVS